MTSRKHLLLYGPLLGLRKILLYIIVTAIVLGLVIYFVANSPWVIKKAADAFAPDYNITYSRIHGNALTGIEIDDLAYNKESLAQHITLRWNPNGLVRKKIIVNKLEIDKANVDTIKALVASFSPADENKSRETNSSEAFTFEVGVHHASLNLEPFSEQGIGISRVDLDLKNVVYGSERLDVGALDLEADSNVTDIVLSASLKKGKVKVSELLIKDINTLSLQTLFLPDSNESNVSGVSDESAVLAVAEDNASIDEPDDLMIPKWVEIKKLEITVLPLVYAPMDIKKLKLTGKNALFDVQNLMLQKAHLDLNSTTNLSDILYTTKVKNNKLIGKVDFKPKKALFKLYELPIRRKAVGDISVDLNVSEKRVSTVLDLQMKQVLKTEKDAFNLDIDNLHSRVVYDIKEGRLHADSSVMLTTPYAENILITNLFSMEDTIHYSGEIHVKQLIGVDAKLVKPLNNLEVKYEGNTSSIRTDIHADDLEGYFISEDFKKANLHLETLKAIKVSELVALPADLNQTQVKLVIDAPLNFEENATLVANARIRSNVLNMDANVSYRDTLEIKSVTHIPKESLLRPYSQELKWDSLNPIRTDARLTDKGVDISLKAGALSAKAEYDLNSTNVDGKITLGGLQANISGVAEEKITINTKVNAISSMLESVQSIYTLEALPVIKGSADLSIVISELKTADVEFKSPEVIYHGGRGNEYVLNDIQLLVSADDSNVQLKSYAVTYDKMKVFASKPSIISMKEENIEIAPLWLNDQLQVVGTYNTQTKKGEITADAETLHIAHKMIELDSAINIKTVLNGEKTSVKGKIKLLGGNIYYDLEQKSYPSDSDILIVQELKKEEPSPFMDNLSVLIEVKTKKPLIYKNGPIDIQADVDLGIHKAEYSDLMVLGDVTILKGGSYTFEGKKFVLDSSKIYFTGNPNKSLLDMTVKYRSQNHRITIRISGTPATPIITFSSVPSLTKEQILSIILFGSEEGAGTNSGEDMMKMMGGMMAKSALSDMGIELDHIAMGSGGSVEVGKKLTDKVTFIYVNDEVPQVRVKYRHTRRLESVLSADEESSAYDIVYKRDYKSEDFIFSK